MKLAGDYLFEATVPEVWSALLDPVMLAAVMPGCEKLELVDGHYIGEIKVKVGPIQGKFTGKVDLQDKVEPESYTMTVDGRGAPGFVKATAQVRLAAEGEGTRVHYDTDAQIGGKIATVGQRLLEASARAIVAQSLEGLHTNIKLRAQTVREAGGAAATAPLAPAAPAQPALDVRSPDTGAAADPAAISPAETAVAAAETAAVASTLSAATAAAETAAVASAADAAAAASAEMLAVQARAETAAAPAPVSAPVRLPAASTAGAPPAALAFTPVKVKQSALANAVAREVASSLFPRSVLVTIILIEAVVIVLLLLRH